MLLIQAKDQTVFDISLAHPWSKTSRIRPHKKRAGKKREREEADTFRERLQYGSTSTFKSLGLGSTELFTTRNDDVGIRNTTVGISHLETH